MAKRTKKPLNKTGRLGPPDIAKHERATAIDTRVALYPNELSGDLKAALQKGYQGTATPELDHLMD